MKFILISFLFILKFNFVYADEKIAFIDLNYIMNNSLSGKSINNFINTIKIKKLRILKILKAKLKKMKMILFHKKILLKKRYIIKKLIRLNFE